MDVKIKNNRIKVGNKELPLLSGEVHYWRLNPANWEKVLESVKELGLDIIATYVPWQYHEYKKGRLDFTGKTDRHRDLEGFIKLADKMGLKVIIRPGPYIYSEWRNLGVPDRVAGFDRLSRQFKQAASMYIKEVSRIIRPYQASSGGPIIMFQPDNEIDPFIYKHPELIKSAKSRLSPYARFLKNKYRSINNLNKAFKTEYKDFKEVLIQPWLDKRRPDSLIRYLDFKAFLNSYVDDFAAWVVEEYRKNKINLPLILNIYTSFRIQDAYLLEAKADLVGLDIYSSSEFFEYEAEHRGFLEWMRLASTFKCPAYIAEFESGIWHGRHLSAGKLEPNHYRLMCLSALSGGIKGWNWYMLVNRDNWYEAPISEWGERRGELYLAFKAIAGIFREIRPADLVKLNNIALTFDDESFDAKTKTSDDVLGAFYGGDIDYDFYPLRKAAKAKEKNRGKDTHLPAAQPKILFYASENWLKAEYAARLADYVKAGGTAVFFESRPLYDEAGKAIDALALGRAGGSFGGWDMIYSMPDFIVGIGREKISVKGPVLCYNKLKGKDIYAFGGGSDNALRDEASPDSRRETRILVGSEYSLGKGRVLQLGLKPSAELIRSILRYYRIKEYSHSLTPGINTAISKKGKSYYLFVMNNATSVKEAVIGIEGGIIAEIKKAVNMMSAEKVYIDKKNNQITLKIPAKDATVIKLS